MRDLHLHVGPQKTGSTFLHALLAANRPRLERAGLGFAPYWDAEGGSHYLAFIAALRGKGMGPVLAETAAVPGARVLVTDEDLAKFLLLPSDRGAGRLQAHDLAAAAAPHFRPRLIYRVRRQDHLAESHLFQGVKTWYSGRPADYPEQDYDHDGILRRLEEVFGRANVTVQLYRDDRPNDLAGAFFAALGLGGVLAALDRDVGRRNVSLHRRKVLLLAHVPKNRRRRPSLLVPPGLPEAVVEVVAGSQAVADDGIRHLLSPDERRALVARHLDGNRALVARYGIADPGGFVELPPPDPAWIPPAPISNAEIAAVFRETVAGAWRRAGTLGALERTARLSGLFTRIAARAAAARSA